MNSLNPPTRPSPLSFEHSRHHGGPSRTVRGLLSAAALLLIPVAVVAGGDGFRAALDFTTGVLCLVALTCSVTWGLVASDGLFLTARQRLLAQAVHRATAVAAVCFLLLHGTVKLTLDHVSPLAALVPFAEGVVGTAGLIGFGALAGLLLLTTAVTGALRSAFTSPGRIPGRWRALHTLAYPAWCAALVHGLYAGREPASWVVALYCLCLVAVAGALALRAAPLSVKRKVARRIHALLTAPDSPGRHSGHSGGEAPARPDTSPLPGLHGTARWTAATEEETPQTPPPVRPFTPPAPPLYEAHPHPAVTPPHPGDTASGTTTGTAVGTGMSAGYRAVSSYGSYDYPDPLPRPQAGPAPHFPEPHASRWPAPSPPPPAEAAPPPPAYDPPEADTPYPHARAPYAPDQPAAHPSYELQEPHELYEDGPDAEPLPGPAADGVCRPPVTGEPWDAPSSAGGRP